MPLLLLVQIFAFSLFGRDTVVLENLGYTEEPGFENGTEHKVYGDVH